MSKHLKRFFAPKTWKIKRKGITFIAKPKPGTHKIDRSIPLSVILRDMLNYAQTKREAKYILGKKGIMVDGTIRVNHSFPVGLFDVLTVSELDENFRVVLDKKGKISLVKIEKNEGKIKPYQIIGKNRIKGKTQLNLSSGKNMIVDDDKFKVGDTIFIGTGKKGQITATVPLQKDALVYLTGGKHIGQTGKVQEIKGEKIVCRTENNEDVETLRSYAFPIGKDKPMIKLSA